MTPDEPEGTDRPESPRRFVPQNRTPQVPLSEAEDLARREARLSERLPATIQELVRCLDDAEMLVALGRSRLDEDMIVQRAAKNLVAEFAETLHRLPQTWLEQRPGIEWHAIRGMRNRVVHVYEDTDFEIVWQSLAVGFPAVRSALDDQPS